MVLRILLVLFKSAVLAALFELLSPVAHAIGLQFTFISIVANAFSHATNMPYHEAEIVLLLLLVTTLLEVGRFVWDLITG